jgi:hypothetical protein
MYSLTGRLFAAPWREDARPPALLALAPLALVRADARPPALLALALVLADARPPALLAMAPEALVRAARAPALLAMATRRRLAQDVLRSGEGLRT